MQIRWDIKRNPECAGDTADVYGVLGLAPAISVRCDKPKFAGTFTRVPGGVSSLVTDPPGTPVTPCVIKRGEERRKKKGEIYIYLDVTHTHRLEPGQPWKARGRKKRTQTTGKRPKQHRGGRERTDLQNQPTRRNGPDKKQSTHLNPITHYGEARGEKRN